MLKNLSDSFLKQWIEDSLHNKTHILAAGYQGTTLLFEDDNNKLVIKVPHGRGISRYIHTFMLRHEHRVYQQLENFKASPHCHGLIDNQYLLLEYVDGAPIRQTRPHNPEAFFDKLLEDIQQLHLSNVAHMDLKKKDNLLVTSNDQPCLIDFGTAVIKKSGFHPLNALWYKIARRFDYNAWVKHKYHNNMENISEQDSNLYRRTWIESIASKIKQLYLNIKNRLTP